MEPERHHISKLIVALNWRREKDELFVAEVLVSREDLYRNFIHVRKKKIALIDNQSSTDGPNSVWHSHDFSILGAFLSFFSSPVNFRKLLKCSGPSAPAGEISMAVTSLE